MPARNPATPVLVAAGFFVTLVVVVGVLENRLSPNPQPPAIFVVNSPPVESSTTSANSQWPVAGLGKEEEDNAAYRVSQPTQLVEKSAPTAGTRADTGPDTKN